MVYFQTKKIPIWVNFGGLQIVFIYFITIWNILRTFGIFYDHSVHFGTFFPFWYHEPRKIWQPWMQTYLRLSVQVEIGVVEVEAFFCFRQLLKMNLKSLLSTF
jgi:hypothetical protein